MSEETEGVRTKYSYFYEGCLRFAKIIQYNIKLAEEAGSSAYAWGLSTGYKQAVFSKQLTNLQLDPMSDSFAHVSPATLCKIGAQGILKKEDGSGETYSFEELMQMVMGFKYTPELITSIDEMVFGLQPLPIAETRSIPYAKGVAILEEAMGDRTVADFPQLPNLEQWLQGERLDQHDITMAMAFLGLTKKITQLYQIYGHELHVPAPQQKEKPSRNGKASKKNGNGDRSVRS